MTSLHQRENTEAPVSEERAEFTGNELDEPQGEEGPEFTGNELDEPQEEASPEFTGNELDEPWGEERPEFTRNELDEPQGEESIEITGDEMDEPVSEESEEITENQQDDPGDPKGKSFFENEGKESKYKDDKSNSKERKKYKGSKKKIRGKKMLSLVFVTGMCLLAMGSYYFSQSKNGKKINSRINIFPVPDVQSFIFEPFIIPFQEKQGVTYISLTLSFELSNMGLKNEIIEKKDQLRGMIYELLGPGINMVEDARSLEKIKTLILRKANTILTSGEVREAIITDFSLV